MFCNNKFPLLLDTILEIVAVQRSTFVVLPSLAPFRSNCSTPTGQRIFSPRCLCIFGPEIHTHLATHLSSDYALDPALS